MFIETPVLDVDFKICKVRFLKIDTETGKYFKDINGVCLHHGGNLGDLITQLKLKQFDLSRPEQITYYINIYDDDDYQHTLELDISGWAEPDDKLRPLIEKIISDPKTYKAAAQEEIQAKEQQRVKQQKQETINAAKKLSPAPIVSATVT